MILRHMLGACAAVAALVAIPAVSLSAAESAAENMAQKEASIPFANRGGIRDWQADRDRGLWVQDVHRNWYYAKLMSPCTGLGFATALAFDTRPMGTFDRFSAIIVPREGRCVLTSLTPSGAPPSHRKKPASSIDAVPPPKAESESK